MLRREGVEPGVRAGGKRRQSRVRRAVPWLDGYLASPERTRCFPSVLAAPADSHRRAETGERSVCLRAGRARTRGTDSPAGVRRSAAQFPSKPRPPLALSQAGEAVGMSPRQRQDLGPPEPPPPSPTKLPSPSPHPLQAGEFVLLREHPPLPHSIPPDGGFPVPTSAPAKPQPGHRCPELLRQIAPGINSHLSGVRKAINCPLKTPNRWFLLARRGGEALCGRTGDIEGVIVGGRGPAARGNGVQLEGKNPQSAFRCSEGQR